MTSQDAKASKNVKRRRKSKTGNPEVGELADNQLDQVQGGADYILTRVQHTASGDGRTKVGFHWDRE